MSARMLSRRRTVLAAACVTAMASLAAIGDEEYPGKTWRTRTPAEAGLDAARLDAFQRHVGGRGCVVRGAFMVYTWGDAARRGDVASAAKPFYSHFLFKAVEDGKLPDLDAKVVQYEPRLAPLNAALAHKDRDITFRHMANQVSCYGLAERPGAAYAYNDWQMALLWDTLFLKVYGAAYATVDEKVLAAMLTGPLGCEDRPTMMAFGLKNRPGRVAISPRDFCRFGLLYLRGGKWAGRQLLGAKYVKLASSQPVPNSIPRAGKRAAEMIPGQRSIGSGTIPDNQTDHMGSYSWLWWTNGTDREGKRHWPDAPPETFGAFGHGGIRAMVILPSQDLIVSWNDSNVRGRDKENEALRLLVAAVKDRPAPAPTSSSSAETTTAAPAPAAGAAYPPSPVIARIAWAPKDTIVRRAPGSDNWPITWADDGHLYTAYGDGWGFEPKLPAKLSLGLARVEGPADEFKGVNIRSPGGEQKGDGAAGRKASGMLCVGGRLYMLVRNAGLSQLAWSGDHGRTWTWADWRFEQGLACPTFLNFGRDYAGAIDGYVYVYSFDAGSAYKPADRMVLARAATGKLAERSAWEFFERLDDAGRPVWTPDIRRRGAVFEHKGRCYRSGISYNAALKRYLWVQVMGGSDTRRAGGLAVYDAPQPWGPWTTACFVEQWDVGPGESACLPTKWMSDDGRTVHLVFSGDDSFSVRKATLELKGD